MQIPDGSVGFVIEYRDAVARIVQKILNGALDLPDKPWHDWDDWVKGLE
jgi:hypothetical protein